MNNKTEVYQLKISLDESEPSVWRRVQVPTGMTLRALHRLIQELFKWRTFHLYEFIVGDVKYGDPEFDPYDELDWRNDQSKKLDNIFKKRDLFKYIYDFGNNHQHTVKLEAMVKAEKGEKYPLCIGGQYFNHQGLGAEDKKFFEDMKDVISEYYSDDLDEMNNLRISRRRVLAE